MLAVVYFTWAPHMDVPAAAHREMLIIVDTHALTLTLYENKQPVKQYPVAVGQWNMPTPIGVFTITRRFIPQGNDFGTRFLGLSIPWGQYGIHGTNNPGSIGSHASHGCIRMFNRDVEELYRMVFVGTKVIIEGGPYGELGDSLTTIKPGELGSKVRAIQRKLRALGYYTGTPDGRYGPATSRALLNFKKAQKIPPIDIVDWETYQALELTLFE